MATLHDEIDDANLQKILTGLMPTKEDESSFVVPEPSKALLRCYGCNKYGNPSILRCACKCTYFCNKECQQKAWPSHKSECAPIRKHFKKEQEKRDSEVEEGRKVLKQINSSVGHTCAVCLENKSTNDSNKFSTITLPCGHRFCYECAREVQYKATEKGFVGAPEDGCIGLCPLCRLPLPMLDGVIGDQVQALVALAEVSKDMNQDTASSEDQTTETEHDKILTTALGLLAFFLDQEPSSFLLLSSQTEIFMSLGRYEEAIVSGKKHYNTLLRQFLENSGSNGFCRNREEFDRQLEKSKRMAREEPSTDFPSTIEELQKQIAPLMKFLQMNVIMMRSLMVMGLAHAKTGDAKTALPLLALVEKLQAPGGEKFGWSRPCDVELTKALAECYLALGKVDLVRQKLILPAIYKFRHQPGLHKLMAECELAGNNLDKALFYAAKGYFYENPWDEHGARAGNLKLWRDIWKKKVGAETI